MKNILKRAAGLDVHKQTIVCTVLLIQADNQVKKEVREFRTFRQDLQDMTLWLKQFDLEIAVMESTSVYWKSPFEALEAVGIPAWVVNARHVKNVPGKKTNMRDSEWLAELALCGLLKPSFIPGKDFRELRMLTRYRRKLTGILSAEKNRLQKILDDAGIKLSSVVSDIDGVSAKAILKVILEKGSIAPDEVMRLAKGKLKIKTHELALSVDGKISDRHRFVLQQLQKHMHELQKQINEIDSQVVAAMQPYNEEWQLLQTIPGIDQIGAAMLLVEIGTDMTRFGNKDSLSSWAGVCPGNNESAGKKKVEERVAQIIMSKLFSANLQMEQLKPAVNLKVDM